jgi:hypothetical protein
VNRVEYPSNRERLAAADALFTQTRDSEWARKAILDVAFRFDTPKSLHAAVFVLVDHGITYDDVCRMKA